MSPVGTVITIVILVLFFMLLRYWFIDTHTLQDIQDATISSTISHTALATTGTAVPSNNFAYSVWFYVNDWNYQYGKEKIIFSRTDVSGNDHANYTHHCPSVVLDEYENKITVKLSYLNSANNNNYNYDSADISNIPIQKWVNLIISVYNSTMDIYLDGKLVRTILLSGVPYIKADDDIVVTPDLGFSGWTSKLQYFPNPLNPQEAWNIYTKGYSTWSNMFSAYHIQLSVLSNGTSQGSVTI